MDAPADAEFRDFMVGRWPGLVRLAYGLTGDQALAEDLAQTALARAYASWPRVRRADDPDAYVRRIVLNANRSRFRSRRVSELLTAAPPDAGAADETERRDDRSVLMAALKTLPAGQRSVVVLRYWLDLTDGTAWSMSEYVGPWGRCFTGADQNTDCVFTSGSLVSPGQLTAELVTPGPGGVAGLYTVAVAASVQKVRLALSDGQTISPRVVQAGGQKFAAFGVSKGVRVLSWTAYGTSGQRLGSGSGGGGTG